MFDALKQLFKGKAPSRTEPNPAVSQEQSVAPQARSSTCLLYKAALFDRHNHPAGHLLSTDEGAVSDITDVIAANQAALANTTIVVPLGTHDLGRPAVDALRGPKITLLINLDESGDRDSLLKRLTEIKASGTLIGILRQPGHPCFADAMSLADVAAVSVRDTEPDAIRSFSAAIRANDRHPCRLMALNIETPDEHRFCHQWHFDLFHGNFALNSPPQPEKSGTDPHRFHLLNLLRLVQGDAETAEIAHALKQDPMLAFRILRYLNSPLIGLDHPIDSISQALTILGRQRLTRWLAVLLFSVHEPSLGDWLLVESALTRGRMMEILGTRPGQRQSHDELFMTGVFSCLDRLLHRPLADILEEVPVSTNVRRALLTRDGPYANLLNLAEAGESFDIERIRQAAHSADLDPEAVNSALLHATAWATEVTDNWS